MHKKKLHCFLNLNEEFNYLKDKYKDYQRIIYTTSPEIIFNKKIKDKVVVLDEIKKINIKKLTNDISDLSLKIIKKTRKLGFSNIFSIYYSNFLLNFSNFFRFSVLSNKIFSKKKILILKSKFTNQDLTNKFSFPIENILKEDNSIKIERIRITNKKFKSTFLSPNFFLRNLMNGLKNFEYILWRKFWTLCPNYLTKGTVLIGIDGNFVRETAVYLSRSGYKFINLPRVTNKEIYKNDKKLQNKIDVAIKDVNLLLSKYLQSNILKSTYNYFIKRSHSFLYKYNYNIKYWNNYFSKFFKDEKIKCLLSTHLENESYFGVVEKLIKKKIPIFSFQHGHGREIRFLPSFEKYHYIFEPLADVTFCFNKRSKNKSESANKISRKKFINAGIPSVYKKNIVLFKNPKHKIIFLSCCVFSGITRSQIAITKWSDKRVFELELSLIRKVFKKIPIKILYKIYPTIGNITENTIKKEIKNSNIDLVEKNYDASYFFYTKRIIITYGASSQLGWALFSGLPLIFINISHQPVQSWLKKKLKKSIFYFEYSDAHFFKNLNLFLSKPINKIFIKWKKMSKNRKDLLSELSSDQKNAGKLAADQIEKFKY